jgi:hypothetical protein
MNTVVENRIHVSLAYSMFLHLKFFKRPLHYLSGEGEAAASSHVTLRTRRSQRKNKISLWDLDSHGGRREHCYVIVLWDITLYSAVDRQQGVATKRLNHLCS